MSDKNRIPPHDIDAEAAVLGSLLIESTGDFLDTIGIKPQDFYSDRHQWIYAACQKLHSEHISINQITLGYELAAQEKLESSGGAAYLSFLITSTPTPFDCPYYAKIVKDLSNKRQLIEIGDKISDMGFNVEGMIDKDLAKIDATLFDFRAHIEDKEIITPAMRADAAITYYTNLQNQSGGQALSTGLIDLDHWLGGGFYPGDLVYIGGRAGIGKTTTAKTFADYMGLNVGNVLYFTCEMPTQSLTDREVAGYLGVPIDTIRLGDYDKKAPGLFDRIIGQSIQYISDNNVYHVEGVIDTERVRRCAIQMKQRYGLKAIFVDYLGLLNDEGKNEVQRIGIISRTLKQIAMQLNVPLISPVQLSRALEMREDKHPQLSDLRDSGSLEQDADVVLFVYRDSYYQEIKDPTTEIIIAKKRQGQANIKVDVYYDQQHQKLCNMQKQFKEGR